MVHYVDYDYYKESYGGTLDEPAFNSVRTTAEMYVKSYTRNVTEVTDDIRDAACACCDILNRKNTQSSVVSSETLDNHSRSYAVHTKTDDDFRKELLEAVSLYLKSSGLMYRGLKCTHIR